jgi:cell volume regulation protein A
MAIPGLVVGVASMIARFIVVLICLAPLRMELREVAYVGAMGLRGAVPIILAIFPVMAGVPNAQQIFDLVFFAVLVNTVLPGAGAGFLARKLGLGQDRPPAPPAMLEMVSSGVLSGGEFIAFTIEPASAVSGARLSEIPMPPESSILLIIRRNEIIAADGNATLGEGDHVYVFCKPQDSAFVRLIFGLPEPE